MKEKILLEQIAKAKLLIENYRLINREMEETVVEMINEKVALQELVDILLEIVDKVEVNDMFREGLSDKVCRILDNLQVKQEYFDKIRKEMGE